MNDEQRKQLGKECMALILKKMTPGEMTSEQYCDALMGLHQKYPMPGHNPPLTQFQLKNYHRITQVTADPETGIKYREHLQPWNFEEAAQMYYWHSRPDYWKDITPNQEQTLIEHKPKPKHLDRKMEAAGDYQEEVPF